MENVFKFTLIFIGVLALVFQGIGIFAPAWLKYDIKIHDGSTDVKIDVSLGLWAATGCVNTGEGQRCKAFTMDELERSITGSQQPSSSKMAAQNLLGDMTAAKFLATIGGGAAIFGLILLFVNFRSQDSLKGRYLTCVCGWALSSILVFAAVGLEGKQNTDLQKGIELLKEMPGISDTVEIIVRFPWAIVMSGIGAFLSTVIALAVSLKMCNINSENVPGTWNKFNNQAI